jgi:hypothetical protein
MASAKIFLFRIGSQIGKRNTAIDGLSGSNNLDLGTFQR